ncbi:uncharacterized protein [Neodiprion pinetum]|uniref:Uncharacterized protein LOC107220663 n=1 Tax=Neodiprion lecontei TaxID=441921 RepID=A0A6J0BJB4_NEOLC|nr:uncharacterized protein LOC107220663 [Neodiprion lecontei]XP_046432950.1 uncharacterized protein LOC124185840 [Neodiprion fabricii]XP_046486425.1 uncharacterized protein LOC124220968 [Neodiprion pinetum]XP_046625418.1 uncharacterized protein LOC124307608 [Neodiprion virginianus]
MERPEEAVQERGRNFRLLHPEELPQLLDFLTGYLPESLKFHQTLLTYLEERVWEFHFYVADGWPKQSPICLHFPGMTLSPHGTLYESVGVFCPGDRLELLKLLRTEDVLLDWSRPLYINFTHCDIVDELVRLYEGTGTVNRVLGDIWACEEPEKTVEIEEEAEESQTDVRVQPLRPEHAEGIHELYTANDMECHELFLRLIKTLPAAGVFAGDRLAAWMVQSYYGAMFSMQTRPEFRRKGYGTKLARYLIKAVADRGYNSFVFIRPENEASRSLYTKLGFRKLYQTARAIFTPEGWEEPESEGNLFLRENLENAVRQLKHRVVMDAICDEKEEEAEEEDAEEEEEEEDQDRVAIPTPVLGSPVDSSAPPTSNKYASEEDVDPGTANDEPVLLVNGNRRVPRTEDKESRCVTDLDREDEKETVCAPSVEDSNEGDGGTEFSAGRN